MFVKVPERRVDEFLDEFYRNSALCIILKDASDIECRTNLEDIIKRNASISDDDLVLYYVSATTFNSKYNLSSKSSINEEAIIICIPSVGHNVPLKVMLQGYWFDDLVLLQTFYCSLEKSDMLESFLAAGVPAL